MSSEILRNKIESVFRFWLRFSIENARLSKAVKSFNITNILYYKGLVVIKQQQRRSSCHKKVIKVFCMRSPPFFVMWFCVCLWLSQVCRNPHPLVLKVLNNSVSYSREICLHTLVLHFTIKRESRLRYCHVV